MQIFPESIRSLWVEWQIRVLVLLSLLMQVILIILGYRRKYSTNAFISFILWGIYLSADWLATMSLGNLASNQMGDTTDTSKSQTGGTKIQQQLLQALWAPFLLLHLGGPDTITAYSLEDNSLWLRHLLGLIVQVTGAFYIFLLSLGNNALSFIAIPVFVSGVIKYSERTLALRAANPDQMRNSKEDEEDIPDDGDDDELKHVHLGYHILPFAKALYANRKVFRSYYDRYLMNKDVFKVIEAQLGFLFDALYTKASITYTPQGLVLRLISVMSIVSALVAFHIIVIIDNSNNANYSSVDVDVVITYILFVGAVSLEIYAFASLIFSDWTIRWLTKMNTHCPLAKSAYSAISSCRRQCRMLCHEKRWSGYMGQLNMVDICLKETEDIGTESSYKISFKFFNLLRRRGQTMVDDDLKSCIYAELAMTNMLLFDHEGEANKVVSERVKYLTEKTASVFDQDVPDNNTFQIDESIIIWHVATNICYYSNNNNIDDEEIQKKCEASKKVSDYLLYILLMRPSMLPDRIERIEIVTNNFNYAISLFHQEDTTPIESISDACKLLREDKSNHFDPWYVIRNAGELASRLEDNNGEKLWDEIWEAWVVMLTYSAYHCEWVSHAQQLTNGGEFLTHISLLLAINGLTDKFL